VVERVRLDNGMWWGQVCRADVMEVEGEVEVSGVLTAALRARRSWRDGACIVVALELSV